MTRTPQPMRRMRYLIGEALRQAVIPDHTRVQLVRLDSWLAKEGLVPLAAFRLSIEPMTYAWVMCVSDPENVFSCELLTAPGPEMVWIGPDLTPVTIQPRSLISDITPQTAMISLDATKGRSQ